MNVAAQNEGGLLFVEDPGALNCIAPLAQALAARGQPYRLLSAGLATPLLRARGLQPIDVADMPDAGERFTSTPAPWLLVGTSENPDSPAFTLVAAAREAGIGSAGVVDSAANAAHRFRGRTGDPFAHAPDWVLVPDEFAKQQFAAAGLAPSRVLVVGHPHHDALAKVSDAFADTDRDEIRARVVPAAGGRRVLVFASEISTGLEPAQYRRSTEYTLHGRGGADGRTEIVVEELLDALAVLTAEGVARPILVLRRHPKEADTDLAAYVDAFDTVSRGGNVFELLFAADAVVGLSSMLLTEAHALGVPALSILPRPLECGWLPEIRDGAIPCATNRAAVVDGLRRVLSMEPRQASPTAGETSGSVDRILAFLETLAA